MYTSELAEHQNRIILFRYNLDLSHVFGVVNTPVYNHAKPSNNVWSPPHLFAKINHNNSYDSQKMKAGHSRHGVKVAEPTSTTAKCFSAIVTDAKANNDILTRSRL